MSEHDPHGNGHPHGNGVGPGRGGYFLETELAWGATATSPPWPDAKRGVALPALREPVTAKPRLDVTEIFRGKNLMLIGSTGFVGKVALSMLLARYPDIGRVYCLVRPGAGNTADERFYKKVASSEVFDPVRAAHGDRFEDFLRSKIIAVPGDIGRPLCNFTDEQFTQFAEAGGLHVILNSAGLVSFSPSLESAIRINALGAKNVLDAARKAGARSVSVAMPVGSSHLTSRRRSCTAGGGASRSARCAPSCHAPSRSPRRPSRPSPSP